jgi:hypothetical protein
VYGNAGTTEGNSNLQIIQTSTVNINGILAYACVLPSKQLNKTTSPAVWTPAICKNGMIKAPLYRKNLGQLAQGAISGSVSDLTSVDDYRLYSSSTLSIHTFMCVSLSTNCYNGIDGTLLTKSWGYEYCYYSETRTDSSVGADTFKKPHITRNNGIVDGTVGVSVGSKHVHSLTKDYTGTCPIKDLI